MSRNELLEQILAARYDFDYAPRELKAKYEKALFALVDKAIEGKKTSRFELLETIHDRYLDYKRERRKREKPAISQRLRS